MIAMDAGVQIHEELEEQVHQKVYVKDLESREDLWGLRLLNVASGIQELKENGLTRELPVWGIIDGVFVNGVIDEISAESPDAQNTTLDKFLNRPHQHQKFKITDTKTRLSSRALPISQKLSGEMQVMVYHHLLQNISTDSKFTVLAEKMDLDIDAPFSDTFIAQTIALFLPFGIITADAFLESPTLRHTWNLLLPHLSTLSKSLTSNLQITYRRQPSGTVMHENQFQMDEVKLQQHLHRIMAWWSGKRETTGVSVGEIFKCSICPFIEGCSWRSQKALERISKVNNGDLVASGE